MSIAILILWGGVITFVSTMVRTTLGFGNALMTMPLFALILPIQIADRYTSGRPDSAHYVTNDAIRKARELGKQEMSGLTGGMQIPGLGNLL